MIQSFMICALVGLCWSAAPLFGRASQLNPWIMVSLVALGSLVTVLPMLFTQNFSVIGGKALSIGIISGIVNGIGLIAWYYLVAGSNKGLWELSSVLPIAIVLLSVMLVIGGRIFFNELITTERIIGLALACGAIWFLR